MFRGFGQWVPPMGANEDQAESLKNELAHSLGASNGCQTFHEHSVGFSNGCQR